MKSIFFALCLMVSLLAQTSQAAEPNVTALVTRAFESSFKEADNVQWSQVGEFMKVNFTLQDQSMFAFYNAQGELVVNGKYMTVKQLPKVTQKRLAEEAKGYKLTEVFEISDGLDSKFYATLDNGTEEKVMVSSGGKWSTFKKTAK
jgi:hypothetical protein